MSISIGTFIRTIVSKFLLLCLFVVMTPFMLIIFCLPEKVRYKSKLVFRFIRLIYRISIKCTLLPIKFYGKENIGKNPAIFICNHQSSLDILILGSLTNGDPHIWLARSELQEVWFLRILLKFFAVVVDLSNARKAMRSLRKLLGLVRDTDAHITMFPEGQRHTDGVVHEFMNGFVTLAKKTGRPVVPVCILGVNKAYPPNTFWVEWYPISVIIGKPFVYSSQETDEEFKERVFDWFERQTGQKQ